jgi:hypothetical protein
MRALLGVLAALLASGCVTLRLQPGVTDSSDTDCGSVAGNHVRVRVGVQAPPSILSCEEARSVVAQATQGKVEGWTFLFTMGSPGWVVDEQTMDLRQAAGMTYPASRVVEVNAVRLDVVGHEALHAYDVDHGIPNHRDLVGTL